MNYFLQAILEDELTTIKIERNNYSNNPRLKMAKISDLMNDHYIFMNQIKMAIESFGVKCSKISKPIDGVKTQELYFFIRRNKKNIITFKEKIGFRFNQNKIENLNKCNNILKATL